MISTIEQPLHADLLAAAPTWRREPYRVLFPLGILLTWAGVGHWWALAVFEGGTYNGIFHSMAQIQGFLMAFATGFLFTAIPRRTRTSPPATWEMCVACVAPVGTTLAAWAGAHAVSQAFWGALILVILAFIGRRFLSATAGRKPPNSFVWIPLSFLMAIAGAGLIGAERSLGDGWFWLHEVGRGLVLQGMFLGLIVGLGGMILPLITRGEAPPDGQSGGRDKWIRLGHVLAAGVLVASFVIETRVSLAAGYGLRAVLVLGLLLFVARIWRRPTVPGWHRWLVWLAAWCLPLGYALAAATPAYKQAGLHVVFVGGFALMALSVGVHVSLAHGGYQRAVRRGHWQIAALGGLMVIALVARAAMTYLPAHVWLLMGVASSAFLLATAAWLHLLLPRIWRAAPPEEAHP